MLTFSQFQPSFSFIPAIFVLIGISSNTDINTTSKKSANTISIKGEYLKKKCEFRFTTEFGKLHITNPYRPQRSIAIQPEPKPVWSTDSEFSYWYSEPFELSATDTVKVDLHVFGNYHNNSDLPKSPDILNGDMLYVYANLIEDNIVCKDNEKQECIVSNREEYVVKFYNTQPITFNYIKSIIIDNSKIIKDTFSKKIRIRLAIYSAKIKTSNLEISNMNSSTNNKQIDEDLR